MVKVNGEDTEKGLENVGDIKNLPAVLKNNANRILGVLPSGFDEDEKKDMVKAMIYLALKAYEEMPALRNCTPDSILKSIMDAASLGMIPFSVMNECAIIPYGRIAQFQIMYRGIYKLAMNTGMFKDIRIDVVRKEDKFNYEKGFDAKLIHIPAQKPIANREIIFFYGLYELKDGGKDFVIMAQEDMDAHRDRYSKQYRKAKSNKNLTTAVWYNDPVPMGLKTILIKLLKYAPKSEKLVKQLALDKVIKREIAPEQKDFTKEAEDDFILERQADVEGSGVYEEEKPEGKKKTKKEDKKETGKTTEKDKDKKLVTEDQIKRYYALVKETGLEVSKVDAWVKETYKVEHKKDLTMVQIDKIFIALEKKMDKLDADAKKIEKKFEGQEEKEKAEKDDKQAGLKDLSEEEKEKDDFWFGKKA